MKKMLTGILFWTLASPLWLIAQPLAEQAAIKKLCGCFEVDFKYAETFASDEDYVFRPRYQVSGMEWVTAEETAGKKWVIQHLLVASDTMIIKHWREDWEFEKNELWQFIHDAQWKKINTDKRAVKGQWTQTVWEVDDAPRYQGTGSWVAANNKYYWESSADAPLPRREYTKRNDYNVMQRTNRIIITDTGWVHEQDNKKIVRKTGKSDSYLAEEKGFNIYRKTDDQHCAAAKDWWDKNKTFWNSVRQTWEGLLKEKKRIGLNKEVDGKFLYEQLDDLDSLSLSGNLLQQKIKETISKYLIDGNAAEGISGK